MEQLTCKHGLAACFLLSIICLPLPLRRPDLCRCKRRNSNGSSSLTPLRSGQWRRRLTSGVGRVAANGATDRTLIGSFSQAIPIYTLVWPPVKVEFWPPFYLHTSLIHATSWYSRSSSESSGTNFRINMTLFTSSRGG